MIKNLQKVEMVENSGVIKVPLKLRIKAWWEGYDMDDIRARLANGEDDISPFDGEACAEKETIKEVDGIDPVTWDEKRIEIAQLVWGDGYCGPGGPEHIIALSKLLAMTSEMSAAVLGAGLGGPSRVITSEFGVWVTGYEENEGLASKGMELSEIAGAKDKAPIQHYDPSSAEPFDRKFDRAFSKEALGFIEDKNDFLEKVYDQLKPEGLSLFTEYVLNNADDVNNPDFQELLQHEEKKLYFVSDDEMSEIISGTGFNIRVHEDITEQYIDIIAKSWATADKVVKQLAEKGEMGLIQVLMKEAEYWNLRSKLLSSGIIKVYRYLGIKPKAVE